MPDKRSPRLDIIFRPQDYDREQIERAREVIDFARQVLAESDPTVLLARRKIETPSQEDK